MKIDNNFDFINFAKQSLVGKTVKVYCSGSDKKQTRFELIDTWDCIEYIFEIKNRKNNIQ